MAELLGRILVALTSFLGGLLARVEGIEWNCQALIRITFNCLLLFEVDFELVGCVFTALNRIVVDEEINDLVCLEFNVWVVFYLFELVLNSFLNLLLR